MSKPIELNLSALQLKIFWKGFALRKCLSMRERKNFPTLIYKLLLSCALNHVMVLWLFLCGCVVSCFLYVR